MAQNHYNYVVDSNHPNNTIMNYKDLMGVINIRSRKDSRVRISKKFSAILLETSEECIYFTVKSAIPWRVCR